MYVLKQYKKILNNLKASLLNKLVYFLINKSYYVGLPDNFMAWRAKLFVRVIIKLEPAALGWTAVISPDLPIPWPSLQEYHTTQSSIGISKHAHFKSSFCLKYSVQILCVGEIMEMNFM